jgi:DNA-binding LytR/AlgR family response regulator
MRILLIEDEPSAMERLKQLLFEIDPDTVIAGEADSLEAAFSWFDKNELPDVILSDIQLGDGNSMDLFEQLRPACPVVFITAFSEYAIQAFRANAIDYLLKPLKKDELSLTLDKIRLRIQSHAASIDYRKLAQAIIQEENKYARRYLIRFGEQIRSVTSADIAYAYTMQKAVFVTLHSGKSYPLDKPLDAIERELDPKKFFRINRQFIVGIHSIGQMHITTKSRVQLELIPPFKDEEVIVSTEKSPLFKLWLGDH